MKWSWHFTEQCLSFSCNSSAIVALLSCIMLLSCSSSCVALSCAFWPLAHQPPPQMFLALPPQPITSPPNSSPPSDLPLLSAHRYAAARPAVWTGRAERENRSRRESLFSGTDRIQLEGHNPKWPSTHTSSKARSISHTPTLPLWQEQ